MLRQVRELLRRREDPYRNADRASARRYAGLTWLITALLLLALAPLAPPTGPLPAAGGWAALAVLVLLDVAAAWLLLRRPDSVSDDLLLGLAYLAVVEVAVVLWLSGVRAALPVTLLWVVIVPTSHPPRRVVPFMAFVVVLAAGTLAFEPWDDAEAGRTAANILVWLVLAGVVTLRTHEYRAQRIGLARTGSEAMALAVTDSLTGLGNRRAFDDAFANAVAVAARGGGPYALVLADVDGFKGVNDAHGHAAGDRCLRRVAAAIEDCLRRSDAAFRWGGDEFVILLAETGLEGAQRLCERIEVALLRTSRRSDVPIEVSFGIAVHPGGPGMAAVIDAADADLRAAKGRRRAPR